MKKRILFLHQSSSIGGGSYCLLNIIKELPKDIFTPIVALKARGPLYDELVGMKVHVVLFPEMEDIPYNRSLFSYSSIKKYYRVLKSKARLKAIIVENKIDALYLNNMMLYLYLETGKKAGIKTIIHIREHWPLNEHTLQLKLAQNTVDTYADRIVAINEYSALMFEKSKYKTTIVYDWIDLKERMGSDEEFEPYQNVIGSESKFLLFTGGFDSMKGSYEVLKAYSDTVKASDVKLVVLGGRNLIIRNNWKNNIKKILEKIGYFYYEKQLKSIIDKDARIICFPSTYKIGMFVKHSIGFVSFFTTAHANLALAENIILGNACLAAETEESKEYSQNGNYALLTPYRDVTLFRKNLQTFVENYDYYASISAKGSPETSRKFDKTINSERLFEVLKGLF